MAERPHRHVPLTGMELVDGQRQFRTKRAQVYPTDLCRRWASAITACGDPNAATFNMVTPAAHRKRPLGQAVPWAIHRQAETGAKALAAGYQLKRSVLPLAGNRIRARRSRQSGARFDTSFFHRAGPRSRFARGSRSDRSPSGTSSFPPLPGLALLGAAGTSAVAADGPAAEADPCSAACRMIRHFSSVSAHTLRCGESLLKLRVQWMLGS